MFIDTRRDVAALRQEGHVQGGQHQDYMALLAEGDRSARTSHYKLAPLTINMTLLTEGFLELA